MINADDDQIYFYDINAMSNFVANPEKVLGFDPVDNLVEYVISEIENKVESKV